ncbi:MAG: putative esterase [Acidobacteriaceae bacterium]|nr:putative esterase [Acidobacteriaceae bacterium]
MKTKVGVCLRGLTALALFCTLLLRTGPLHRGLLHAQETAAHHSYARVVISKEITAPVSGHLLVFARPAGTKADPDEPPTAKKKVDISEFHPTGTSVAAVEIHDAGPGSAIEVELDHTAFPAAFVALPRGDYELQAVLDTNHSYNYSGRGPQDWQSEVVTAKEWQPGSNEEPVLTLNGHPEAGRGGERIAKAMAEAKPGVAEKVEFESPTLTKFWGRPTYIRAWLILPPGYDAAASATYPAMYWTHGFGGDIGYALLQGLSIRKGMVEHKAPPMILVMLDESCPEGTHEFADSVNNGPWGTALTKEFIPQLETKYRLDRRRRARLLNGHSSGGWATLQLQVNYPQVFGGTWSTSPDPSDFHNFTGPNLYAEHANVYRRPDGGEWPIMRDKGKVLATLEQFAKLESVLGPYGGQLSSFEWVFSPKGPSGAPEPMFDRLTGEVDPQVVAYWRDHYDLAHLTEEHWARNGELLKGRIHLFVGTADTFYLDGAARLFEARLRKLGADPHFAYIPERTHFDLYKVGDDRMGLMWQILSEMYAEARPGVNWKASAK